MPPEQNFEGREAKVDGRRMHYIDQGAGPPLLLLHGAGPAAGAANHYARNIETLSREFRVVAPDQPGFGNSQAGPGNEPLSVVNARAAARLLEHLGIQSAFVVGYSMGGSAAMRLCADHGERVKKAIFLGGGNSFPSFAGPVPPEGIKVMTQFRQQPTRETFDRLHKLFVYDAGVLSEALLDALWAEDTAFRAQQAGAAPTPPPPDPLFDRMPHVKVPTLIVRARDDVFGPLDQGIVAMWAIPNSRLYVIPRCGHWIQYEKPQEFHTLARWFFLDGPPA